MTRIPPPDDVPPPKAGGRDDRLLDVVAEVGELRARVDRLTHDHDRDQETIRQLTELAPVVGELSSAVERSGLGPALDAREGESSPERPWCWVTMSDAERADALTELAKWIAAVLRARYPHRAAIIRPCWPEHPTVVEELSWLYGEWRQAYLDEDGRHRDAGEWHDRWLPGVLHRLNIDGEFSDCDQDHAEQLRIAEQRGPDAIAALAARSLRAREHHDAGEKPQP